MREKARERFERLSPEQKREIREKLRERRGEKVTEENKRSPERLGAKE
jgi:hypothetical protein